MKCKAIIYNEFSGESSIYSIWSGTFSIWKVPFSVWSGYTLLCQPCVSLLFSVSLPKPFSPPPLFSPNVLEKAGMCTAWKKQKEHLKLCCLQVTNNGQLVGSDGNQGFRIIPSKPHDPISEDGDLGACSHIKFWW